MGWLTGWRRRIALVIDNAYVSADLSNFPVLIHLSTASGITDKNVSKIFTELGANSQKIAVTTDNGTTECYVEIEYWNNGGNEAWLWAKIPTVTTASDTTIYLYYDASHANNTTYIGTISSAVAQNVWDSNFMVVHHLEGADNASLDDSTGNNIDINAEVGTPEYNSTGKVGRAIGLERTTDVEYIGMPDNTLLSGFTQASWELWFNAESLVADASAGWNALYEKTSNSGTDRCWSLAFYAGGTGETMNFRFNSSVDGATSYAAYYTWRPNTAQWYHIQLQWYADGSYPGRYRFYIDGVSTNFTVADFPATQMWTNTGIGSRIGGHHTSGRTWDGLIDEVRLSNTERSAAYAVANYNSQIDNLITYGVIETQSTLTEIATLTDTITTNLSAAATAFVQNMSLEGLHLTDNEYGATIKVLKDRLALVSSDVSNKLRLNFEEGIGTTTEDKSGNRYIGTLSGTTWSDSGKFGKCVSFDGNDNITFTETFDYTPVTVAVWIKCATGGTGADRRIICTGSGNTNKWIMTVEEAGYGLMTAVATSHACPRTNAVVNDNAWHHIVGISNPESIYMDGVLQSSTHTDSHSQEAGGLKIGTRGTTTYNFIGLMDDVLIFNRALSAREILDLYTQGETKYLARTTTKVLRDAANLGNLILQDSDRIRTMIEQLHVTDVVTPIETIIGGGTEYVQTLLEKMGLVSPDTSCLLRLDFDEGYGVTNGSIIKDTSGNQHNGTIETTGTPSWETGVRGYGFLFDKDTRINLGLITDSSRMSWAFWYKGPTHTDYQDVMFNNLWGTSGSWWILRYPNSNGLYWEWYNGTDQTGYLFNDVFLGSDSTFVHIAVTADFVSGLVTVYKNGEYFDSMTMANTTAPSGEQNWTIGRDADNYPMPGVTIDEVLAFNRILDAGEVASIYSQGEIKYLSKDVTWLRTIKERIGLVSPDTSNVLRLNFEETSGSTIKDTSGYENHGTAYGDPGHAILVGRQAIYFDSLDDYINCGHNTSLDITSQLTMCAWITMPDDEWGDFTILFKDYEVLRWTVLSTGKLRAYLKFGGNSSAVESTGAIADVATWHHVAFTYDGTGYTHYIDGVACGHTDITGNLATNPSEDLRVGYYFGIDNYYGCMDDILIFNRGLSASEIANIYAQGEIKYLLKDWDSKRTLTDILHLTDTSTRIMKKMISNTITLLDTRSKLATWLRTRTETITLGNLILHDSDRIRTMTEQLHLTDTKLLLRTVYRRMTEILGLDEGSQDYDFVETFESNNLSQWDLSNYATIQSDIKRKGNYAVGFYCEDEENGGYVRKNITSDDIYVRFWIYAPDPFNMESREMFRIANSVSLYLKYGGGGEGFYYEIGQSGDYAVYSSPEINFSDTWHCIQIHVYKTGTLTSNATLHWDGVQLIYAQNAIDIGEYTSIYIGGGIYFGYSLYVDDIAYNSSYVGMDIVRLTKGISKPILNTISLIESEISYIGKIISNSITLIDTDIRATAKEIRNKLGLVAPDSSNVLRLDFEENSGRIVGDTSGRANNGTIYGVPVWSSGKNGKAITLNGTSNYIEVLDSPSLDMTNITVMFWMKPNRINVSWQGLIHKYIGTSNNYTVYLELNLQNINNYNSIATTTNPINTIGTWYHVTYSATSAGVERIYVNGSILKEEATQFLGTVNAYSLYIGAANPTAEWFQGDMDDIRIYNRELSESEIVDIYNQGETKYLKIDTVLSPLDEILTLSDSVMSGISRTLNDILVISDLAVGLSTEEGYEAYVETITETLLLTDTTTKYIERIINNTLTLGSLLLLDSDRIRTMVEHIYLSDTYSDIRGIIYRTLYDNLRLTSPDSFKILHFDFNEYTGNTLTDISGRGRHGTINKSPDVVTGRYEYARDFDDAAGEWLVWQSDEYVTVPDDAGLKWTGGEFTISVWFNVDSAMSGKSGWIISKAWNGSGHYNYRIGKGTNDKLSIFVGGEDGSGYDTQDTITFDTWHHVVLVLRPDNTLKFYLDNNIVIDNTWTVSTWTLGDGDINVALAIANIYPGEPDEDRYCFDGMIDEIIMWNRALDSAQVSSLYSERETRYIEKDIATPITETITLIDTKFKSAIRTVRDKMGLVSPDTSNVLRLDLEENYGTVAKDTSGYQNNGIITDGTWVDGGRGKGLRFDGNSTYIACVANSTTVPTAAITVGAWVNVSEWHPTYNAMVVRGNGSESWNFIIQSASRKLFVETYINGVYYSTLGTLQLELDTWYHVMFTFNGTNVKTYINGQLDNTSADHVGTLGTAGSTLTVGRWNNDTYFFNGMIDEVLIYNRALQVGEIKSIYEQGEIRYLDKDISHRPIAEIITLSDTMLHIPSLLRQLNEVAHLTDSKIKSIRRTVTNTLSLVDSEISGISRIKSEILHLTDNEINSISRTKTESLHLTDTKLRYIGRTVSNILTLSDNEVSGINRVKSEVLHLIDTKPQVVTWKRIRTESITLGNLLLLDSDRIRTMVEQLHLTDTKTIIKTWYRVRTETVSLTDTITKYVGKIIRNTLTLSDTKLRTINRLKVELVTLSDTKLRMISRPRTEVLTLTDIYRRLRVVNRIYSEILDIEDIFEFLKGTILDLFEDINLIDNYSKVTTLRRITLETIILVDSIIKRRAIYRIATETATLTDSTIFNINKYINNTINITSNMTKDWDAKRSLVDGITLSSNVTRLESLRKAITNTITLADNVTQGPLKNIVNSITLLDTRTKIFTVKRIITDTITLGNLLLLDSDRVRTMIEQLHLTDSKTINRGIIYRSYLETLHLTSLMYKDFDIRRQLSENVILTASIVKKITSYNAEILTLVDNEINGVNNVITQALSLTDSEINGIGRIRSESLHLIDNEINSTIKNIRNTLILVDNEINGVNNVITQLLSLTDNEISGVSRIRSELLHLTDNEINTISRIISNTITLTGTMLKDVSWLRTISGVLHLTDTKLKDVSWTKIRTETLVLSDTFRKTNFNIHRILSDTLFLGNLLLTDSSRIRTMVEQLHLTSTVTKIETLRKIISNTIVLSDLEISGMRKIVSSSLVLSDSEISSTSKMIDDIIILVDNVTKENELIKRLTDTIILSDIEVNSAGKMINNTITLLDTINELINYNLIISDIIILNDIISKNMGGRILTENISLDDLSYNEMGKMLIDSLILIDSIESAIVYKYIESIITLELINRRLILDLLSYGTDLKLMNRDIKMEAIRNSSIIELLKKRVIVESDKQ